MRVSTTSFANSRIDGSVALVGDGDLSCTDHLVDEHHVLSH